MGLFDRKYCSVCGEKIGLLGNRKLEDGNLCKECAAKLSPWFDERRHSTVDQIKDQLDYREANREEVAAFHTTCTLGRNTKVLLDEDAGKFMVTSARNLQDANPDVLSFSQVTGCDIDIQEHRSEEMREVKDQEGRTKRVSYNPPQYSYSYDFYVIIRVNTPYFDEIKIKLNSSSVEVQPVGGTVYGQQGGMYGQQGGMYGTPNSGMYGSQRAGAMSGQRAGTMNGQRPGMGQQAGRFGNQRMGGNVQRPGTFGTQNRAQFGGGAVGAHFGSASPDLNTRMMNNDYAEYSNMAEEIKASLTQIRSQVREDIAMANAPKAAVTCPYCGATTTPDASGCCEFCGGALNG